MKKRKKNNVPVVIPFLTDVGVGTTDGTGYCCMYSCAINFIILEISDFNSRMASLSTAACLQKSKIRQRKKMRTKLETERTEEGDKVFKGVVENRKSI